MLPENLALLASVITSISFSISDTIWKIPLRVFSPEICIFIRNICTTLFLGIMAFLAKKVIIFDFNDVFYGICVSSVSFFGLYFFGKSQKYAKLSLIAPLLIFGSFITFLIGIFYWGESANTTKWLCFGLCLVGTFLISFQQNHYQKEINENDKKGIKYVFLAAIFWGISYAFFRDATLKLGAATFGFILEATILTMSILVIILSKIVLKNQQEKSIEHAIQNQQKTTTKTALFCLLIIAILGALGVYCTNLGYQALPVSSMVILGIFGNIFPVLVGKFFYKEQISRQQYAGIVLQITALAVFKFV